MTLMEALSESEIQDRLKAIPQWQYKDNAIQRIHTCHEYLQSLQFIFDVGQMAEKADHHPDLMLNYKRATVRYWTHRAKGVTSLDFDCAEAVEKLITEKYS